MTRTFRYPLLLGCKQRAVLEAWLGQCCTLYNAALEQRIDAYRKTRTSLGFYDQAKDLTDLRRASPYFSDASVEVQRSALRRLDRAFKSFFRRVKAGQRPGFPRFRARDRYDSFSLGRVRVSGNAVYVPKLGPVRFKLTRPLQGAVREVQLRRDAKRWYACIVCDFGAAPEKRTVVNETGLDLGLEAFATLADGTRVANPRALKRSAALLAERQRKLARKRRGSNARKKARRLVAGAYERIQHQRLDFARKLAKRLTGEYDFIAVEKLDIAGMAQQGLAKSINDAAWRVFLKCLESKAEEAGSTVVAVPARGTTATCSNCGAVAKKALSQRLHACPCGLTLHRDVNAAINILAAGRAAAQLAGGLS